MFRSIDIGEDIIIILYTVFITILNHLYEAIYMYKFSTKTSSN